MDKLSPSEIGLASYPSTVFSLIGQGGRAQVMYPYASSFEQTAEKLEYDMYYLRIMSKSLFVIGYSLLSKN